VHRTRPAFTAQHAQSCLPREVGTTRQPRRQGAHTISAAKGDQTLVQANFALLRDLCTHQKKRKDCKFLCFFDSFIKFQIPRASPSTELLTPLPAHFWGHVLPRFTAARTAPHTSIGSGRGNSGGARRLSRRLYSALGASQRSRLHVLGAIVGKYSLLVRLPWVL